MNKPLLSKARLRRLFDYEDGVLIWRERPRKDSKTQRAFAIFKSRFANKSAGTLSHTGYVHIEINGVKFLAHRLIWVWHHGRIPKNLTLDHIDSDKSNNRIENLRIATRSQNSANAPISKRNTSGFKGVQASGEKWSARIRLNGKAHHLGSYTNIEDAIQAYAFASDLAYGEFTHPSVESKNPFRQLQLWRTHE